MGEADALEREAAPRAVFRGASLLQPRAFGSTAVVLDPLQVKEGVRVGEPIERVPHVVPERSAAGDEARLLELIEHLRGGASRSHRGRLEEVASVQPAASAGQGAHDRLVTLGALEEGSVQPRELVAEHAVAREARAVDALGGRLARPCLVEVVRHAA